MNGVVELPGEAAPLGPRQILYALQSASSSHQQAIQTGTQQLQTWEVQRSYYPLLQVSSLSLCLSAQITENFILGYLPRQVFANGNPISGHHPAQEWH